VLWWAVPTLLVDRRGARLQAAGMTEFCQSCGYDLRGHHGEVRRCPECATVNQMTGRRSCRRVPVVWLYGSLVAAACGLIAMIGFRLLLSINGLSVFDLYRGARPLGGVPRPGAADYVGLGTTLATVCIYLAAITLLYSIILALVASYRRDWKALAAACASVVVAVWSGLLAFQLGLIIAGI
jgi:hypothetical protein